MSIILDPNKSFVTIDIYYVEEKKDHGNTFFHFINGKEEFEEWKEKGYKTKEEIIEEIKLSEETPQIPSSVPRKKSIDPEKLIEIGDYKIINKLVTHWRQLTWKESNSILSRSMKEVRTDTGYTSELDPLLYRDFKLKTALKGWNAKDDKGYDIPLNEQAVDNLIPEVAAALLINYEKVCEQSSEEFKNKEEKAEFEEAN